MTDQGFASRASVGYLIDNALLHFVRQHSVCRYLERFRNRGAATVKNTLRSATHRALISVIVELRQGLGLSQREFAMKLGESNNFVWRIEAGERRVDIMEFCKIAKALEADPVDVLRRVLRR
jgi:ribosome-binding protein aMBF1 (putative translation factor)